MTRVFVITILAACAGIAAFLFRDTAELRAPAPAITGLPWQIETLADGSSRVFGLEPGHSTLDDARLRFGAELAIGIIAAKGEDGALEVYYKSVTAGVITGKMILVATLDSPTLAGLRSRSVERKYMNDTTYRYILDPADLPTAWRAPIATITFIPSVSIDAQTVLQRFGPATQRVAGGTQVEHFLYPEKGLAVTLDNDGKDILQYVAPRDFARLRDPLEDGKGAPVLQNAP